MENNYFLYYALETLVLNALQRKRINYYHFHVLECNAISVDSVVFDTDEIPTLHALYDYSKNENVRAFCLDAIRYLTLKK